MGSTTAVYFEVTYLDKEGVKQKQTISSDNLSWFLKQVAENGGSVIGYEAKG